jgi:hypothetical protein
VSVGVKVRVAVVGGGGVIVGSAVAVRLAVGVAVDGGRVCVNVAVGCIEKVGVNVAVAVGDDV